jgi:hypothetical protein
MKQEESDFNFSPLSMMDDFGRVFFKSGRVFRAIHNDKKDYCLTLLQSQLFNELSEKKLIPKTTIANFKIDDFELVLEHEKLLQTFQHEWTFSMIQNVALTILQINTICGKYGYELKDAHMFNVLFRGTQPVWVDLGSISPKGENKNWIAYEDFLMAVIVPLLFWSENQIFIARKLLESIFYGITTIPAESILESGLLKLLKFKKETYRFKLRSFTILETEERNKFLQIVTEETKSVIKKITGRNISIFSYNTNYRPIKNLSDIIDKNDIDDFVLKIPRPSINSLWNGYHKSYFSNGETIFYSSRFKRILEIIRESKNIDSLIDLAGNEGLLSKLLITELPETKIILADYDQNAIDNAYNNFRKHNCENVTTLLLNLMYTPDMEGTSKRLQSDLVLALAITHHLTLTGNYSLPAIFERISSFSKRYVMIEFMPLGLWSTKDKEYPSIPEWYNLNWFKKTFEYYFHIILEENLEENRILFFGEKKEIKEKY